MLQTTIQRLRTLDTTGHELYVIKNAEHEVLYVGQSVNVKTRIRQHSSNRETLIGMALSVNYPQSEHWEVDLYTVDECVDLIKRYFPYAPKETKWESSTTRPMVTFAEDTLIHDLAPRYNLTVNLSVCCGSSLPFYKRKPHPEVQKYLDAKWKAKEKAEEEQRRDFEERQNILVNSVCTICGERDKWTYNNTGLLCGVYAEVTIHDGESWANIPLVCHDCNDVINHMNAINRNEDRVRKIRAVLRKQKRFSASTPPQAIQMTLLDLAG